MHAPEVDIWYIYLTSFGKYTLHISPPRFARGEICKDIARCASDIFQISPLRRVHLYYICAADCTGINIYCIGIPNDFQHYQGPLQISLLAVVS